MGRKQVKKSPVIPPSKAKNNSVRNGITLIKAEDNSLLSTPALVGCALVALLSLIAGIMTPPYLFPTQPVVIPPVAQRNLQKKRMKVPSFQIQGKTQPNYDCSNINDFLHENEIAGIHVICLKADNSLDLYLGAKQQIPTNNKLTDKMSWGVLKEALDSALNLKYRKYQYQPWGVYSSAGELLATEESDKADVTNFSGIILLMEGGVFVWPGVRIGFQRVVDLSYIPGVSRKGPSRTATIETLSLYPLVLSVQGFLDFDECDYIQEKAAPSMKYSDVSLKDSDAGRPASDFRTSQSTFLPSYNDPLLTGIDERTASLVRVPYKHQEHVQVLRYGHTEKYDAHNDYFDPDHYRSDPGTLSTIENGARNRLATVFWYLSDVSEGGETIFPRFNGAPQPYNFKDCTKGLKVKPQRGKVIVFYSMKADGSLDELSLHGSCPVESKEEIKWAANKWVWSKPMGFV